MLLPRFALLLTLVGLILLMVSVVLSVSRFADWTLDTAQGFLILAVVVFLGYVFAGFVADVRREA
jgi:hypothetical protein